MFPSLRVPREQFRSPRARFTLSMAQQPSAPSLALLVWCDDQPPDTNDIAADHPPDRSDDPTVREPNQSAAAREFVPKVFK